MVQQSSSPMYSVHTLSLPYVYCVTTCRMHTTLCAPVADHVVIPYGWKFSRDPFFVVFAVDWQTMKIKSMK